MRAFSSLSLVVTLGGLCTLAVDCGGKVGAYATSDGGNAPRQDGSASTTDGGLSDGSVRTDSAAPGDGPVCVEIDMSSFGVSCTKASDCIPVLVGQVCSGACDCGGTGAISVSGQAKYLAALAAVQLDETCPCAPLPPPICAAGVCTRCDLSPNEPPACMSEGVDGAGASDGATECVTVPDLYAGCNVDSDCTSVATGTLCSGQCACPNTPVNKAVLPTYDALISPIQRPGQSGVCSCPNETIPVCVKGSCSS
jgi:hypothetical protein